LPKPGVPGGLGKLINPRLQSEGMPLREGFLLQSKAAEEKQEKAATENLPLEALFQHRMVKKLGLRLANMVKFAHLPLGINSIMVRINPRTNDVFTLVDAIEGSAYIPQDLDSEYDGMDGGGYGEQAELTEQNGYGYNESPEQPRQRQYMDRSPREDDSQVGYDRQPVAVEARPSNADDQSPGEPLEEDFQPHQDVPPHELGAGSNTGSKIRRRRGRPPLKSKVGTASEGPEASPAESGEKPRRGRPAKKPVS
jgi:hypothetical protein